MSTIQLATCSTAAVRDDLRPTSPAPIRPAARAVLEIVRSHGPAYGLNPLRILPHIPWDGDADTRVEDALAALVVLEAQRVLWRSSSTSCTWQYESYDDATRQMVCSSEQWHALLTRLWASMLVYVPLVARRPQLTSAMLRQLVALSGGGVEAEQLSRVALQPLIVSQRLRHDASEDDGGTVRRTPTLVQRPGESRARANAQFLREHCTGETPWIAMDSRGAYQASSPTGRVSLQITEECVRSALAADRAHAGTSTDALVHLGKYGRTRYITIAALHDVALTRLVSPILPTLLSWTSARYAAGELTQITDASIAAAVSAAAWSELAPIAELLRRLGAPHDAKSAPCRRAAETISRLLDEVRRRLLGSTSAPAVPTVHGTTGISWSAALALANAQPGRSRTLRLSDLRSVLSASAHAYLTPRVAHACIDVLAAPAGVSAAAVILAARRFHRDSSVRAEARESLSAKVFLRHASNP